MTTTEKIELFELYQKTSENPVLCERHWLHTDQPLRAVELGGVVFFECILCGFLREKVDPKIFEIKLDKAA